MKTSHIEILAPAGSWESMQAAIDAGADSVYLGIADFNMRATAAKNFDISELSDIVKLTHENEVKVFVTVNTVLYDDDLDTMRKVIDECKKAKVDAVICSDMAAIQCARKKRLSVHISTQLSVSNIESLKYYSQFADRVILARELDLKQIKRIVTDINRYSIKGPGGKLVEVEIFAHGAMCVAVSGRCWMSLFGQGTSANRGKCSQKCRRRYKVIDIDTDQEMIVDNNYVMSAADLCTIGMLLEIVDTGISALKFEGRGRPPEYVDTVIRTYREALSAIEKGKYNEKNIKKWRKELKTVFNRGQSEGLYRGIEFAKWAGTHGSKATKERFLIGKVDKYFPKAEVAQVTITSKNPTTGKKSGVIKEGEQYMIIGKTTGLVKGKLRGAIKHEGSGQSPEPTEGRRKTLNQRFGARQGDVITFKVEKKVRKNDEFYVVRDRESLVPRGRETIISK
jgi:putative protease